LQHLQGILGHAAGFCARLTQGDGWRIEDPHIDKFGAQVNLDFGSTDQPGRYSRKNSNQGQKNEGIDDIEKSMRICDVTGDVGLIPEFHPELLGLLLGLDNQVGLSRGDGGYNAEKKWKENQHVYDTKRIEQKVSQGGPARRKVGAESGKVGRDGGPDVFAEDQGHACFESQQTAAGQGESDADRCGAALNDHRQDGPEQHAEEMVVADQKEQLAEIFAVLDRVECVLHDA